MMCTLHHTDSTVTEWADTVNLQCHPDAETSMEQTNNVLKEGLPLFVKPIHKH